MLSAMQNVPKTEPHGRALKLHRNAAFGEVSNIGLQPQIRMNRSLLETGTALAREYPTFGVAPDLPCSTGRGGARNLAARESHALSAAHVANLTAAAHRADTIGRPFTRMITIHWEAAGIPLESMVKATGHFTDLLGKFLARHESGSAWLWTHENCGGKGGHCHLLAHVPAALVLRLTGLQRGWLRRITGNKYRANVIYSTPIGGRLGLETGNPELHAINLEVALAYVLKGAPQDILDAHGIDREHKPGGRVIGRRCSTSENIAVKARTARRIDQ